MAVNIVCCVKQVPDPETPASAFKVDEATKKAVPAPGIAPVISQFDQIAVEAAVEECDRFYPAFQFVLWGDKSPAEAMARVGRAGWHSRVSGGPNGP